MKLENQVCSLDLAKRLKELGVKQESYFWWQWFEGGQEFELADSQHLPEDVCAFTVAELGEMLPSYAESYRMNEVASQRLHAFWACKAEGITEHSYADTEADARAKMLCYLLEDGLIQ